MRFKATVVLGLAGIIACLSTVLVIARQDDQRFVFTLPSRVNSYSPRQGRPLLPQSFKLSADNWVKRLAPELDINQDTLRLPEIVVPDAGGIDWIYQTKDASFDSDLNLYDGYKAQIEVKKGDVEPVVALSLELKSMKFEGAHSSPQSFTKLYTDDQGNSLRVDRTEQSSGANPEFQKFIDYSKINRDEVKSPPPTRELVGSFEEKWILESHDRPTTIQKVTINSIKYESNFHRFISGYEGTIKTDSGKLQFEVISPHNIDGTISSLEVKLSAKGAPSAKITWNPADSPDSGAALQLLRDNLPVPVLVGPRTGFRLNGVDIPDQPLKLKDGGSISDKQVGSHRDMGKLIAREDLGIKVSFSPPAANEEGNSISISNLLKNLGHLLSGQWSAIKAFRQDAVKLRDSQPKEFVLAFGFKDPKGLSFRDLKKDARAEGQLNSNSSRKPGSALKLTTEFIKLPFKVVAYALSEILRLPVVKPLWTATRVVMGGVIGFATGDNFDRPTVVKFDKSGAAMVLIAGVRNNEYTTTQLNNSLKDAFGISDGTAITNYSHWFGLGDVIQVLAHEYLSVIDRPAWDAARAIRQGIAEKGEVFVVAHSQGSAIFKQALALLSPHERGKIHYLGLGPEWIITAEYGLASATNILNHGDPIPYLGNKFKVVSGILFPWNYGRELTRNVQKNAVGENSGIAHSYSYYKEAATQWINQQKELLLSRGKLMGSYSD